MSAPTSERTAAPPIPATFVCATCEIEVAADPVLHLGLAFCCVGCAAGGPCTCSYDGDAQGDVRECLDVRSSRWPAKKRPVVARS